jgi:plastocyanin
MRNLFMRLCRSAAILVLLLNLAGGARADTYTVLVRNVVFDPAELTITEGDSVVWQWVNGTHSTTSDDCPCCVCLWDSTVQPTGCPPFEYQFTFDTAGDYTYHCTVHQALGMVGVIHVMPAPSQVAARQGTIGLLVLGAGVCGLCGYVGLRRFRP